MTLKICFKDKSPILAPIKQLDRDSCPGSSWEKSWFIADDVQAEVCRYYRGLTPNYCDAKLSLTGIADSGKILYVIPVGDNLVSQ
jgi:hypothetical protein